MAEIWYGRTEVKQYTPLSLREAGVLLLENSFSFSSINPDYVEKRINKINVKKATGIDGISPKLWIKNIFKIIY
jgi:hypothetical protein